MKPVLYLIFCLAVLLAATVHKELGVQMAGSAAVFLFAFAFFSILSGLAGPEYSVIGWVKDRLVPNAANVWKRWSIKIAAAQVVLVGVWAALQTIGMTPEVPDWLKTMVVLVFSSAAVTAAFFPQKNLPPPGGV